MNVNNINSRDISFNGFWSNKFVKKGLEFASDNGTLFAATTILALSTGVRTLSIFATPKTEKENKKIAASKSIISGIIEFGLALAISAPISAAFKKIDKSPTKYLKSDSIEKLQNEAKTLKESKAYSLATQIFKLGISLAIVLPKAILTALGIPVVLDKCFSKPKKNKQNIGHKTITFQGKYDDTLAKSLGKLLNNKSLQDFAIKNKESNFPMHILALKDVFATTAFVNQAQKNKKIKEEQKPFLIKNSIYSTALSIISSYTIDKLTEKQAQKIADKIKKENINDPNLAKYLEGFKIIKPIFILAFVYYTIIPIISTFFAQLSENLKKEVQ